MIMTKRYSNFHMAAFVKDPRYIVCVRACVWGVCAYVVYRGECVCAVYRYISLDYIG